MNWGLITALAIVGTIAVVVALVYVARQIKEATHQRRVESYHSVLGELDALAKLLAQDHSIACDEPPNLRVR